MFVKRTTKAPHKWPDDIFQYTVIEDTNPLAKGKEWDLAIITPPEEKEMMTGIHKLFKERYPELAESGEQINTITQSTIYTDSEGTKQACERQISRIISEYTDEKLFDAAIKLKEIVLATNKKKVALPNPIPHKSGYMRKLLECVFHGTEVIVSIHSPPRVQNNNATSRFKSKGALAFIITQEGASYSEMLKKVKGAVDRTTSGSNISTVKETQKGELLIVLKNNPKDTEGLEKQLSREYEKC